jgi:hypothetical protein
LLGRISWFLQEKANRLIDEWSVNRPDIMAYMKAKLSSSGSNHELQAAELALFNLIQFWAEFDLRLHTFSDAMMYIVSCIRSLMGGKMKTEVFTSGQERAWQGKKQPPTMAALGRKHFHAVFNQPLLQEEESNGITLREAIACFISDQLHRDRTGELVDISILARIVQMCRDISTDIQPDNSASHFIEAAALKESRAFFRQDAEFWLSRASIESYCKHVAFHIGREAKRNVVVFRRSVADALTEVIGDEFIRRPMKKLLQLEPKILSLKGDEQGEGKELMRRLVDRFRPAQTRAVMVTDLSRRDMALISPPGDENRLPAQHMARNVSWARGQRLSQKYFFGER